MKFNGKKGGGKFVDRTSNSKARVEFGQEDIDDNTPRYRQARTAGENDEWVPLKLRNGYHRSRLGKVAKEK